mmetsp:Transcript_1064/g.2312  ORF Transcript_1064/g.2312 Transcript_1064/m.2312 type:complete len:271 (-) Transcript_1064:1745-2557(-)
MAGDDSPPSTSRYTSAPPRNATTIWPASFADATVIKPMGSSSSLSSSEVAKGDQCVISSNVAESTRRTSSSTTWSSKSCFSTSRFPANKADLEELNPGMVTSASAPPSSSSSISLFSATPSSSSSILTSLTLCTPSTLVSLTKPCTKNASSVSLNLRLKLHMPLIPSISTAACSRIPTPLRTSRTVPSFPTPEQVTTRDWLHFPPSDFAEVCSSLHGRRSKSTMGPRFAYSSTISTYVVSPSGPLFMPSLPSNPPLTVPTGTGLSRILIS